MVEGGFGDIFGVVERLGTGITHDNVDMAEMMLCFLEEALNFGDLVVYQTIRFSRRSNYELKVVTNLAHVCLNGDCPNTGSELLYGFDYLVGPALTVGIVDDDAAAALGQFDSDAFADAAAGAGDDGDFAVERSCRYDNRLL
jgi:hypothetical protein